ncbi:hypothetical protein VPH35_113789 [Triticum aestivum]
MALRKLAAKLRIPTSAAARLPLAPDPATFRLPPDPSVSRVSINRSQAARDWYEFQRTRYDDVTREFKNFRREVVWSERAAIFSDLAYKLGCPLVVGTVVIKGIVYQTMRPCNVHPPL